MQKKSMIKRSSVATDERKMKGICKLKQDINEIYRLSNYKVKVILRKGAKCEFKYSGNNTVIVENEYMSMNITRKKFDKNWDIVECDSDGRE